MIPVLTDCSPTLFEFAPVERRSVVAAFDGGRITSDAGAVLLGAADRAIRLTRRMAACFTDTRNPLFIEHEVQTLVLQRVVGIALGYEDLNDHDQLRHDPVMATLAGKLTARRHRGCAPLAGKSTLNRLELSRAEPTRYHKLAASTAKLERLFVDLFLDAHAQPPSRSSWTSTPPTTRCTAIRRAGSSTATMIATATCRSTCSAGVICWGQAASLRPRRIGRGRGGDRACCRPNPHAMAAHARCVACRYRLRP